MTRHQTISFAKIIVTISVVVLLVGYGIFNFRTFISGPNVTISEPQNGSTIEGSPLVKIAGKASHISVITLNDREINVEENGNFNESLLLQEGYNVVEIKAKDKFDREIDKKIELFFDGNLTAAKEIEEGGEENGEDVEEENGTVAEESGEGEDVEVI